MADQPLSGKPRARVVEAEPVDRQRSEQLRATVTLPQEAPDNSASAKAPAATQAVGHTATLTGEKLLAGERLMRAEALTDLLEENETASEINADTEVGSDADEEVEASTSLTVDQLDPSTLLPDSEED